MTLTLDLATDLEQRLTDEAGRRGMPPDQFVVQVLRDHLRVNDRYEQSDPPLRSSSEENQGDRQEAGENLGNFQDALPADDPIGRLYDELATLTSQQALQPGDAERSALIGRRLAQLRNLQEEEAAAIGRFLSQHLALPMGTAQHLLQDATELIRRHENPSPSN